MIKEIKLSEKLDKNEIRTIRAGEFNCGCGFSGGLCGTAEGSYMVFSNSVDCTGIWQKIEK